MRLHLKKRKMLINKGSNRCVTCNSVNTKNTSSDGTRSYVVTVTFSLNPFVLGLSYNSGV